MPARVKKIRHDENTRDKIQVALIVRRLETHILGQSFLDATQVSAALGLLRKKLPDLASQELNVTNEIPVLMGSIPTEEEWIEKHKATVEDTIQ